MSKYSAGNMAGGKLPSTKGLSLSGPNLCIRYCGMQDNILKQRTLYGEAKPHKDNYYLDALLNSQLQIVLRYNQTVS